MPSFGKYMTSIEVLWWITPISTSTGISNNMLIEEFKVFSYVSSP
jgi:hypothetical protein